MSKSHGRASLSPQTFHLTVLASSINQLIGPFYSLFVDSTNATPYNPLSAILSLTLAVYPTTLHHTLYALCGRMPVCSVCTVCLVCPYFTPNQHISNFRVKTTGKIRSIPVKKLQDFPKLL